MEPLLHFELVSHVAGFKTFQCINICYEAVNKIAWVFVKRGDRGNVKLLCCMLHRSSYNTTRTRL